MTPDIDRRVTPPELLVLVQQIHDNQMQMSRTQQAMDDKLSKHMKDETKELAEEIAKLMLAAFPDGDPDGHKADHLTRIAEAKARIEFWQKMKFELVKWGLFGFLGWAVYYGWKAFLVGPRP